MKISSSLQVLALSTLAFCVGAQAAERYDSGKREYMDRCAVCHGESGKGDGGMIDILRTAPSDLTTLSHNNGGVFPFEHVYAVIDGRQAVKGHGSRDMPIWGKAYSAETVRAGEHYVDMPYNMEMYARARILSLIDYLNRIQAR